MTVRFVIQTKDGPQLSFDTRADAVELLRKLPDRADFRLFPEDTLPLFEHGEKPFLEKSSFFFS